MEKVVVVTGEHPLSTTDMQEINDYLSRGWFVKSTTTHSNKSQMTVIFVIEKAFSSDFTGTYESNPLLDGRIDCITFEKDGRCSWSFCGGDSGIWKKVDGTILVTPTVTTPFKCEFCLEKKESLRIFGRIFSKNS